MSRRFLDNAEDLVDSGLGCDLRLRDADTGAPTGCDEERTVCEADLCLHCCGGHQGQGLSEASLERAERLAEAGMRCGVILGPGARSKTPQGAPGVQTICDGEKVCYVCRQ